MRISDWSSDVCSSDLCERRRRAADRGRAAREQGGLLVLPEQRRGCDGRDDHREHDQHEHREGPRPQFGELRSEEHTSELQSLMRISYDVFCLKQTTNLSYNIYIAHNYINLNTSHSQSNKRKHKKT